MKAGERGGDPAALCHENSVFPNIVPTAGLVPERSANTWFLGQKSVFKVFHTTLCSRSLSGHEHVKVLRSTAAKKPDLFCLF